MEYRLIAFLIAVFCILPASSFNRIHPLMFTIGFPMLSVGFSIIILLVCQGVLKPVESHLVMTGIAWVGLWSSPFKVPSTLCILVPFQFSAGKAL